MTAQAHAHPHPHAHPHAEENPDAGQGSVLLDIGGDVGALVVVMPDDSIGREVDIWPLDLLGTSYHPEHVAVVSRPTPNGSLPTLVYGALRAGDYALCAKGSTEVELRVSVAGGAVTQEDWPHR